MCAAAVVVVVIPYLHSRLIALGRGLGHRHGRRGSGPPAAGGGVGGPVDPGRTAASSPVADAELVLAGREEDPGDERVEYDGQQEGDHVEEDEVGEEHDQVLRGAAAELQTAGGDVADSLHAHDPGLGEEEPGRAVDDGEAPAGHDDLLGPGDGADGLGLHRVTDGDVPLHGERGQRQRRGVDAQVLQEQKKPGGDVVYRPRRVCVCPYRERVYVDPPS